MNDIQKMHNQRKRDKRQIKTNKRAVHLLHFARRYGRNITAHGTRDRIKGDVFQHGIDIDDVRKEIEQIVIPHEVYRS